MHMSEGTFSHVVAHICLGNTDHRNCKVIFPAGIKWAIKAEILIQ